VVYNRGSHIGIYIGEGKVISALVQPWGVSVHGLRSINLPVTYILKVNWGGGDGGNAGGGGGNDGGGGGNAGEGSDDKGRPGDQDDDTSSAPDPNSGNNGNPGNNEGNGDGASGGPQEGEKPGGDGDGQSAKPESNAVGLGTMNLRTAADPNARIIGWVGRNSAFKIIGSGKSPAGYDWFEIQTRSGKTGWVYARWVRQL
jgi:hypothetical protein